MGKRDFEVLEISDERSVGGSGRMMVMYRGDGEGEVELRFRPEEIHLGCEGVVKFDAA